MDHATRWHRPARVWVVGLALAVGCSSSTPPATGTSSGVSASMPDSASTAGASGSASGSGDSDASDAATNEAAPEGSTDSAAAETGADAGPFAPNPSPGCFKANAWTGATNAWVAQPPGCDGQALDGAPFDPSVCQAIPPGSTPPASPMAGDPQYRGWWTFVPTGYAVDPAHPYKLIVTTYGCPGFPYFAGKGGYPYQKVDNNLAIQVGLDLDIFSQRLACYDTRDPASNDLVFVPWLMTEIENELCVDMNHEFFSTYADDASEMQQLNCAMPSRFRGSSSVSGFEPGAAGSPGSLPTCVSKPTAAFFVHDFNDTETPYANILPGCTRVLRQNGCAAPDGGAPTCDPLDTTLTSPYTVPASVKLPTGAVCRQFNGCPAYYPVVFCVTYNQGHFDGQNWGVVPLFWDWMENQLR